MKLQGVYEEEEVNKIKRIDIKEFREFGFLQELNRCFLHPLGLALEVIINEDGTEKLGGIWDYRDDPEGMSFVDLSTQEHIDKFNRIQKLHQDKQKSRLPILGFIIQPIGHKFTDEQVNNLKEMVKKREEIKKEVEKRTGV